MTTKQPYAPPPGADDVDDDTTFDGLPSDQELNFNERGRDWYDEGDDSDFENNDDEFEDDDVLIFSDDDDGLPLAH